MQQKSQDELKLADLFVNNRFVTNFEEILLSSSNRITKRQKQET